MNTKEITITIVLAAVTIVLNPALTGIGVPAPYAPFLIYQIWEIPIVAAFLLLGPKYGISISLLNVVVLIAIFPGALISGPIYNLIAILAMLLGIFTSQKLLNHDKTGQRIQTLSLEHETKYAALSTALGVTLRVTVMTVVNYIVLRYPAPIGYSLPEEGIIPFLPLIAIFNATLALYTIPIGYVIADAVKSNLKITH